jgi:hypothetical protein
MIEEIDKKIMRFIQQFFNEEEEECNVYSGITTKFLSFQSPILIIFFKIDTSMKIESAAMNRLPCFDIDSKILIFLL